MVIFKSEIFLCPQDIYYILTRGEHIFRDLDSLTITRPSRSGPEYCRTPLMGPWLQKLAEPVVSLEAFPSSLPSSLSHPHLSGSECLSLCRAAGDQLASGAMPLSQSASSGSWFPGHRSS